MKIKNEWLGTLSYDEQHDIKEAMNCLINKLEELERLKKEKRKGKFTRTKFPKKKKSSIIKETLLFILGLILGIIGVYTIPIWFPFQLPLMFIGAWLIGRGWVKSVGL